MQPCCQLAMKENEDWILYETENFFVMPTIGPMGIPGYVMVLSKKHYMGIGNIPIDLHPELSEVLNTTKKVIEQVYNCKPQIFEHGPRVCEVRGGGCLDHAHLHVVPGVDITKDLAVDMMTQLKSFGQYYKVDRIEGFERMAELFQAQKSSYLFVESPNGLRIVSEVNFHIPSQYIRRMIASRYKKPIWDWGVDKDIETVNTTIKQLQKVF